MTLDQLADMYGVLAWAIPSLISGAFIIVVGFYVSRDRKPRSTRRKRGF